MVPAEATRPFPDPLAVHGGNLAAARRRFPEAPRPWLDLSTGLNPVAYPVPPILAEDWARLPDPEAVTRLEMAARRAYGVADASAVVAAPGSGSVAARLPAILPGRDVRILGPTYGGHAQAWSAAGRPASEVAQLHGLEGADVAILVNPNNPDGRLIPSAVLHDLARSMARRGGTLVVDEAFMDVFAPGTGLLPGALPERCIVLRSFGKAYGLGGVRLGFAVLAPDAACRLRDALGPWPIAGPAIAIGCAALADDGWLHAARRRLTADGAALDRLLEVTGCRIIGGTPLFRLVRRPDAAALFERLARDGILVRPFAGQAWLRFGIPCRESDRTRLIATLGRNTGDSE